MVVIVSQGVSACLERVAWPSAFLSSSLALRWRSARRCSCPLSIGVVERLLESELACRPNYWDCAAARERVEHPGSPAAVGFLDLSAEPVHVGAVLVPPAQDAPLRPLLDRLDGLAADLLLLNLGDDLAADLLQQFLAGLRRPRIGQQRGDQRRPARCQRPPRGPDVQRRDVPMPDILLVDRVERRLLEWEGDFDQAGVVGVRHRGLSGALPGIR